MSYELVLSAVQHAYEDYVYLADDKNAFIDFASDRIYRMRRDDKGNFIGDCDDWAVKFYDEAATIGVSRNDLAFVLCKGGDNTQTQDYGWINHIGCFWRDPDGQVFFMDCNYRSAVFRQFNNLDRLMPFEVANQVWRNWYSTGWGNPINSDFFIWVPE